MHLYHGSRRTDLILKHGVDINYPRVTDAGDLGWGWYLTDNINRAKTHGKVLIVRIDASDYAFIANPYFIQNLQHFGPRSSVEKLFYDLAFDAKGTMLTVSGTKTSREQVSKQIRDVFLAHGYKGIITSLKDSETVVFDQTTILSISPA